MDANARTLLDNLRMEEEQYEEDNQDERSEEQEEKANDFNKQAEKENKKEKRKPNNSDTDATNTNYNTISNLLTAGEKSGGQLLLFIGKSKQGKTHLLKSLLLNMCDEGKFQFGIVFTTTRFNKSFDFMTNQKLVIPRYDENILKQYLRKVRELPNKPSNFIIFDDILGDLDIQSAFVKNFISTFRHYNCTVFLSTQYAYAVSPLWREQCDICFIFRQKTGRSLQAVYEAFGSLFGQYKEFTDMLARITSEKYRCLVFDGDATNEDEKYSTYIADKEIPDINLKF